LFPFAYDWRRAIEDNANLLDEYVQCVRTVYPNQKVNIVTHSMGGLVARRYIIDHPNVVNELITVAAPFLGSAKPLYQMQYGLLDTELSMQGTLRWALYGPAVRDMPLYFPGLHELMLSRQYYELGGPPYAIEPAPDMRSGIEGGKETETPLSYDDWLSLVDRVLPGRSYNGKTAAQTSRDFHEYSRNGNSQDDWSHDTTGVRYYHLFGVQHLKNTPQSLPETRMRRRRRSVSRRPSSQPTLSGEASRTLRRPRPPTPLPWPRRAS
jgi:pimeloyl-ACP methyl ester carboxylesterase